MAPLVRRTQAPRGKTPVLKQKASRREKVSVIAALTRAPHRNRLGLHFRTRPEGYFNGEAVADFLRELLRHLRRKVVVIWGNGNMHKGEPIRAVLRDFDRLTLERLPPYAPDLNPVEWLWSFLKYGEMANYAPRDATELDGVVTGHLEAIRRKSARLKSFYAGAKIPLLDRAQPT
jgi:transposase